MSRHRMLAVGPPRTYALVLDAGDSVVDELLAFADEERLQAASLTAIGGFREATLAYFDPETRRYVDIPVDKQVEVLSFAGDIVRGEEGGWALHAHAVVGDRTGGTRGGHVRSAVARPTLEVMITESPSRLRRKFDEASGLALIDLEEVPVAVGGHNDQIS